MNQFTREAVVANDLISLVDKNEEYNLDLFCYENCDNNSSDFVKQSRGLVFNNDTLILKALSYADEYTTDDSDLAKLAVKLNDVNNFRFFVAHEGTLLRMFYFKDKWFLCTHKKLDAFRSKWSSRESFGNIFVSALNKELNRELKVESDVKDDKDIKTVYTSFCEKLDKTKQYLFLLRNTKDNRIVCYAPTEQSPSIYFVGYIKDTVLYLDSTEEVSLPRPLEMNFTSLAEIANFVNSVNPFTCQGIICFDKTNNFNQIKILNQTYVSKSRIRNNEASVKFRYLQVRGDAKLKQELEELYPEFCEDFNKYEKCIEDIACFIHKAYITRFIHKNYVVIPKDEYTVLSNSHNWHKQNREHNIVTLDVIRRFLKELSPVQLNHAIKRFLYSQQQND